MRAQLSRVGLTRLRIYFTEAIKPFRIIVTVFGSLDASFAVKQFEPSSLPSSITIKFRRI